MALVKITDSVTTTSSDIAASATAVKTAYDLANTAKTTASGKADESHNQAASTITTGTFPTTAIYAKTGTDYNTARIRNISYNTSSMTAKSSSLSSGNIYLQYE